MFSLFKLAIDAAMALGIFYLGIKAEQKYPNFLSKVGGIFTWLKGLASKL